MVTTGLSSGCVDRVVLREEKLDEPRGDESSGTGHTHASLLSRHYGKFPTLAR
jgi:hypothetical protein